VRLKTMWINLVICV